MKAYLSAVCLSALSTVACSGAADIPATPDLRKLLQDYERPSASLDGAGILAALNSVPNLKELAGGLEAARYLLQDDVDYASKTSSSETGSRLRLQGSLGLNIRCPGEAQDPVYDEKVNGSISLTIAIAESQILSSMGGQAKACVLQGMVRGLATRVELDGPIAFDLGGNIGIGKSWSGELLASLPGELRVGEFVFQSVSARFTQGRFQHLVRLPPENKSIVLELSNDDGVTIRDGSGVWFCREGQSCAKQ